ncbi:unnamed protein product, partial [Effrenium voratum]
PYRSPLTAFGTSWPGDPSQSGRLAPWMDTWQGRSSSSSLPRSSLLPVNAQGDFEQADEYFRVVIRVRPPLDRELTSPVWQHVVSVPTNSQICLYETIAEVNAGDRASGTTQVVNTHTFSFDYVYDQDASQPEVYENAARPSVQSALQGYNATVVAYGPTGTGKTYTMEGSRWHTGIIPRSMEDIFQNVTRSEQSTFQVRASYLQIYNEVISDLLKPDRSHLMIREDKRRGVFVEGLSEWLCRSPDEVETLMEHGSAARATAQTGANDTSSRSHAVFIIVVERSDPSSRVTGRLNLVDLAGSERPRVTGATGQRLEETKKINQSLSALGNVIAALTERKARSHVPYRDSKLTRLLEDSLGGNCRTTMMAMVSPAAEAFAESLSTLKFAQRAKGVLTTPQVNEDLDPRLLARRYEAEIRRLRTELAERDAAKGWPAALKAEDMFDPSQLMKSEASTLRTDFSGGRTKGSEEEKAQVGRYKQLLLKQRDIMIALTQRLHERDETIIGLQAELDSRDHRANELQERLERQAMRLAAAEKALQASSKANMASGPGLFPRQPPPVSKQPALPEAPSPKASPDSSPRAAQVLETDRLPRHLPESRIDSPTASQRGLPRSADTSAAKWGHGLLNADDKVLELTSLLETQRQENHRMKLELESMQDAPRKTNPSVASTMASLSGSDATGHYSDFLGRFRERATRSKRDEQDRFRWQPSPARSSSIPARAGF